VQNLQRAGSANALKRSATSAMTCGVSVNSLNIIS
jgi:hypothetical protein